MSIVIHYSTWERDDSCGMFDYSQEIIIPKKKLRLINSSSILRSKQDYSIHISNPYEEFNHEEFEHIITAIKYKNRFYLRSEELNADKKVSNEPLCRIITEEGFALKANDILKIGKIYMQILDIEWGCDPLQHYKSAKQPYLNKKIDTYTTSFYSGDALVGASMLESNPACRYCFGKTISQENPFVTRCECTGSSKYTHVCCLIEWIKRKAEKIVTISSGIYSISTKALFCEVCHAPYQIKDYLTQIFDIKTNSDKQNNQEKLTNYLLLNIKEPQNCIYLLQLDVLKSIVIGRGYESNIIINDLSVSRKHCTLIVDKEELKVTIHDSNAKFGTVIKVKKAEITGEFQKYQKGRTRIDIKVEEKKSFFEKLRICIPQEELEEYKQ